MPKSSLNLNKSSISKKDIYYLLLYLRKNLIRHSMKELIQKYIPTVQTNKLFYLELLDRVEQGNSFAFFLQEQNCLPPYLSGILIASEEAGDLTSGLEQVVSYLDNTKAIKNKLITALIYPMLIVILSVLSFFFFIMWFIPIMAGNFSELNIEMSATVKLLLQVNKFLRANAILLAIIFPVLALIAWTSKDYLSKKLPFIAVKIPGLRNIMYSLEKYQFYMGLNRTLSRKKELLSSLKIVQATLLTKIAKNDLSKMLFLIHDGQSFSTAIKNTVFYDVDIYRIILLNEESGELQEGLLSIEEQLKAKYTNLLDIAQKIIEPALILLVGMFVLIILIIFMEPLNSLVTKMNF